MAVLAAAASAGAAWLFFETNRERTVLSELASTYDDALQKSSYAATVRALLRDTETERAELDALVKGQDPVEVIRVIESLGDVAKVKVTVDAVSTGDALKIDPTLSSFFVTVSADGTFDALHHFVSLLSTLPIPSRLEQMRMEWRETGWHATAGMRIFVEGKL